MTKKIISASVILALVVVLCIALYFLSRPEEPGLEESSATPEEVHYVLGSDEPVLVKSLDVKNENASFSVDIGNPEAEKLDRTYSIRTMESLPANRYSLSAMASSAEKITAYSLVSENKADFPVYGLDKPLATVDVHYIDGSSAKLLIGNKSPGIDGYYVTASDKVYLVLTSSITGFLSNPMSLMDTTITPGDPEQGQFINVTLGGTVRPEPIVITPVLIDDSSATISSHVITSPVKVDLDSERGVVAINTSFGLVADEVSGVKTNSGDIEKFGLAEPYSTIKMNSVEYGIIEISSSAPDSDGNINIMTNQSDLIYKVRASVLAWLDVQVYDIMARLAILPNIDTVSDVDVMMDGKYYTFKLSGEKDGLKVTIEGKELDTANFRKLYQNFLFASFDTIATEELSEDAKPVASYTYTYKDSSKSPDVVKFYAGPARRYFITLNDGTPYFVPVSYLEKVSGDIVKAIAGEEVLTIF